MNIQRPALGPIIGHTTDTTCRLWIAAYGTQDENDISASIRTIGIIGIVGPKGKVAADNIYYFRMRRQHHRTGAFTVGKDVNLWKDSTEKATSKPFTLSQNKTYQARMAFLKITLASNELEADTSEEVAKYLPPASVWFEELNRTDTLAEYVVANFKTQPSQSQSLSFLLGSCRNNWFNGINFAKSESDRIFYPMYNQNKDVNFVLMVGDQVYADSLGKMPLFKADTYKEFDEIYHEAYGTPNFKNLASHLPVYMILDDHEITNNWTQDQVEDASGKYLFNCAISAYRSYQWIHGPQFEDGYFYNKKGGLIGSDKYLKNIDVKGLFYDFNCCGFPFFVLDTRTSRFKNYASTPKEDDEILYNNHLLGRPSQSLAEPNQLDRLCAWLRHMQNDYGNRPKFIVSSGVFVPNEVDTAGADTNSRAMRHKDKSDSWAAYPQTRNEVLKTIIQNKIENVIFLSGDIHCTNIASMGIKPKNGDILHAWSVTSSPFYWPYEFIDGNPENYIRDSTEVKQSGIFDIGSNVTTDTFTIYNTLTSNPVSGSELGKMDYQSWCYTQKNNFAKITVDATQHTLTVQFFSTDGKPIETSKQSGSKTSQPEIIQLIPWD